MESNKAGIDSILHLLEMTCKGNKLHGALEVVYLTASQVQDRIFNLSVNLVSPPRKFLCYCLA
jgi:hypothetical protein